MDKVKETLNKVPLSGYIVLVIAIAIFSGLFANAGHGLNIFDFDTLNGKFGTMKSAKATFSGQGRQRQRLLRSKESYGGRNHLRDGRP